MNVQEYGERKTDEVLKRIEAGDGFTAAVLWVEAHFPDLRPRPDCDRLSGEPCSRYELHCDSLGNPP